MSKLLSLLKLARKAGAIVAAIKARNWALVGAGCGTFLVVLAQVFFAPELAGHVNAGITAACGVLAPAAPAVAPVPPEPEPDRSAQNDVLGG
jgi:hypothetical protein